MKACARSGSPRADAAVLAYIVVAIGSALGGVLRYACTGLAAAWFGAALPWGTIAINILGSFVIGGFAAATGPNSRGPAPVEVRAFVMVGLCGGYTTFSSFSLQTFELLQRGDLAGAAANVGLSVVLCLAAVWLGHAGATALGRPAT
ncbi:MAG: fluoride efflux transporter CrcB [Proteobacteria bacterium]|nr:fluoride efflux transporter CrcB [Pseudomonadota bacterium]